MIKTINPVLPGVKRPFRLEDLQAVWQGITDALATNVNSPKILCGFEVNGDNTLTAGVIAYKGTLYMHEASAPLRVGDSAYGQIVSSGDLRIFADRSEQVFSFNHIVGSDATDAILIGTLSLANLEAWKTGYIGASQILTAMLGDKSVTTLKIADSAVDTLQLKDESVTTPKIAPLAVGTVQLKANSVTMGKIAPQAVGNGQLAFAAVATSQLADHCITTAKLTVGAVETPQLYDGCVITDKIADATVTNDKLRFDDDNRTVSVGLDNTSVPPLASQPTDPTFAGLIYGRSNEITAVPAIVLGQGNIARNSILIGLRNTANVLDTGGNLLVGSGITANGSSNTALVWAGQDTISGDRNVVVGHTGGGPSTIAVGDCTVIGAAATATQEGATALGCSSNSRFKFSTGLGYRSTPNAVDQVNLGSAATSTLRCQVALSVVSDARDKAEVVDIDVDTADKIIYGLRPVAYKSNPRNRYPLLDDTGKPEYPYEGNGNLVNYDKEEYAKETKKSKRTNVGFLAQDVQQLLREVTGGDAYGAMVQDTAYDNPDVTPEGSELSLTYEKLIPLLVLTVQQLRKELDALKSTSV